MRKLGSGMLLIGLHESFQIPRIKAQSPPDLYERNPSLPNPTIEGGDGYCEVPRGHLDRQKPLWIYGLLLAFELGFPDQRLAPSIVKGG
jgi:hypothetical protein